MIKPSQHQIRDGQRHLDGGIPFESIAEAPVQLRAFNIRCSARDCGEAMIATAEKIDSYYSLESRHRLD